MELQLKIKNIPFSRSKNRLGSSHNDVRPTTSKHLLGGQRYYQILNKIIKEDWATRPR